MIDEALVTAGSAQPNPALREHLQSCTACQQYLAASSRVIASLGSFSFDVDPLLQGKVVAAIRERAPLLQRSQRLSPALNRNQFALVCMLAVVLTVAGSFFDLQLTVFLSSALKLQGLQLRQGLLTFWIVPSLCLLLLFPVLPLLAARKERVL